MPVGRSTRSLRPDGRGGGARLFAFDFGVRDPEGRELYRALREPNRFFTQGEGAALRVLARAEGTLGAQFFGRLYNDTPADNDNLSDLTGEPASNGYQAIPWSRNTTDFAAPTIVAGVQQESVGGSKVFSATGNGFGPVTAFVFATTSDNSGIPVAWAMLGGARSFPGGSTLTVTPRMMIRGVTT